jgi:hypothetical protein
MMKSFFITLIIAAGIGENLALGLPFLQPLFMTSGDQMANLKAMVFFDNAMVTFWPSSLLLMLTDRPGPCQPRPEDAEIWITSILLNGLLYAVIGIVGWFLFRILKRWREAL